MVKATFKGKREPMELEKDMILGATIQYDAIRDSGAFIIGDVKFSILPGALARMAVAFLKAYFSGEAEPGCECILLGASLTAGGGGRHIQAAGA